MSDDRRDRPRTSGIVDELYANTIAVAHARQTARETIKQARELVAKSREQTQRGNATINDLKRPTGTDEQEQANDRTERRG